MIVFYLFLISKLNTILVTFGSWIKWRPEIRRVTFEAKHFEG